MSALTRTRPIVQHPDAATRAIALKLINRCLPVIADGIHDASTIALARTAADLECFPPSPVVTRMRGIVEAEQAARTEVA